MDKRCCDWRILFGVCVLKNYGRNDLGATKDTMMRRVGNNNNDDHHDGNCYYYYCCTVDPDETNIMLQGKTTAGAKTTNRLTT